MDTIVFHPIGLIHTPFKQLEGMPIQPAGARDATGRVAVDAAFADGLADIEGFSHIILIYLFHRSRGYNLKVTPFLDTQQRGLFSTRAPRRPNPIGLSVVRLIRCEGNQLHVDHIDVLDGTPLLDIKPFVPSFDSPPEAMIGWLQGKIDQAVYLKSDQRFTTSS
jgi:tRNA-Thr(GGU) m(6)t(6)A37 methyltransferase TsaA